MADVASNLYSWSTTAASNSPSGSTAVGTGLDDNLREIQAVVRQDLASKGADIASATTTDIGAVAGHQHHITGTTTITGLGTVAAGIWKILTFDGALTLTHNATSLILPTGANITTAAGDTGIFISEGSGNWRCVSYHYTTSALAFTAIKQAADTTTTGVVELATAAETLTGTDTTRAVTASGIASNASIAAPGYFKLPGGLIIQWLTGTTHVTAGTGTNHSFPITFPTAVFGAIMGPFNQGVTSGNPYTVTVDSVTTTYAVSKGSSGSIAFFCIAIGN